MRFDRRVVLLAAFGGLLGLAQRAVPPVSTITTEEGQRVAFDTSTFQMRELTKKLPPQEPWPAGPAARQALERYGLNHNTPARAVPVEIARGVYLVGQERLSNLTYMLDCGPQGVAIIDPTEDSEFDLTVANVEKCGRSRKDIRWVLNTHCHVDHAMADKKFQQLGAQIILHEADAEAVEKGTQVTAYFLLKGLTAFPRCPVARRLSDGEELELGNQKLLVIHTPGHTPGSACFLLTVDGKNLLFSGDTVLYDGRLGWQGNPYADNHQYLNSLRKLASFTSNGAAVQWDLLLPGHGAMAIDKAYLDVEKARASVEDSLARGKEVLGSPFSTPEYRQRTYGRPATTAAPANSRAQAPPPPATEEQAAQLRALIRNSPRLPLELKPLAIQRPSPDWETDYVSSVAAGRDGTIYVLHRNLKLDNVVALDSSGRILRSWGRGLYAIPHSVRIDPDGNVWTVDAGSSVVLKFSPQGKQLLRIDVGELPESRSEFRGTADIAFAPGGRMFIADGYGNARVLEYDGQGRRVRAWGAPGTGPGQFHLPHGIATRDGILYVADRENGRIQRFDLDGRYLGEWTNLGKTFSVTVGPDGNLWIGTQPRNLPNGAEGWLVKVDRATGKVLGYVDSPGFHAVNVTAGGEPLTGARSHPNEALWFRRRP